MSCSVTRRDFNYFSLISLLGATPPVFGAKSVVQPTSTSSAPSRHEVIRQHLPGEPAKQISLVEVVYPPGTGSPPHLHANGVMAFVVSGSVASKVGDEPEQVFRAGEAWWEPPGAVHRVSRNASHSADARLLAIYIAPSDATDKDLMQPI